ncbi:hypothetical protein KUTeg_023640 [Tegillarca granosa]|uniref:BIG2 domain-containing protein n=1 Tax=Tegillarca granosa TaxID=220873 RepID=A0ABQ9E7U5_TEGGR|nr:hypothetical protein KUTeg_023640 [Tegillarca granosa]
MFLGEFINWVTGKYVHTLTIKVGNDKTATNQYPAKEQTSIRFSCSAPVELHLQPSIKSSRHLPPCPVTGDKAQPVNFQTLKPNGIPDELVVTATISGYNHKYLKEAGAHISTKIWPKISKSLALLLVEEATITPDTISVFNHPSNKVLMEIEKGSGYFFVDSAKKEIVKIDYREKKRQIQLVPVSDGSLTVTVYDLCVDVLDPPMATIYVSGVGSIELTVMDKVEVGNDLRAKVRVLDVHDEPLLASFFPLMGLKVTPESNIISVRYVFPPLELIPKNITLIVGSLFQMPMYAVGLTEHETPFTFGSAIPPLTFVWSVNNKDVVKLQNVLYKSGVEVQDESNFATQLVAMEPGQVTVRLEVTPQRGSKAQVLNNVLLSDELQIQVKLFVMGFLVFEKLAVINPSLCDGKILMTPNTEAVVKTNRDGSAKMTYTILPSDEGLAVVNVSDGGLLTTGSANGQAALHITAQEEFGTSQTLVLLIKVKPVSYLMINSDTTLKTNGGILKEVPVGTTLHFTVSYHDNVGEQYDLVRVEYGTENNTLIMKATKVGQTILKVIVNPVRQLKLESNVDFLTNVQSRAKRMAVFVTIDGENDVIGKNCITQVSEAMYTPEHIPFKCYLEMTSVVPNMEVSDFFQVAPDFDSKSGKFGCLVSIPKSNLPSQQISSFETTITLSAVVPAQEGQPEVRAAAQKFQFLPAFYVHNSEIHLSNLHPLSSVRVSTVPKLFDQIEAVVSDSNILEALAPEFDTQSGHVSLYPIRLLETAAVWEREKLDVFVELICKKTGHVVKLPVFIRLIGQKPDHIGRLKFF